MTICILIISYRRNRKDFCAINYSIKHKNIRIEIFKIDESQGYTPTYTYYKSGELLIL